MTNHEMITIAMQGHRGETLTTAQIRAIVLRGFPQFNVGSLLPNDHGSGNKSCCWCVGTKDQIFNPIRSGLYRVFSGRAASLGRADMTQPAGCSKAEFQVKNNPTVGPQGDLAAAAAKIGEPHAIAACCVAELRLEGAKLGNEYFYQSLPQCVIDAVYSIGVRYEGVQNAVRRYCDHFGLQEFRQPRDCMPATSEQQPLSALVEQLVRLGAERFAREVARNSQRTSARGGILKSDAVFRFSTVLRERGINFLQDARAVALDGNLEAQLRRIPGQGTGISISYFFMLTGTEDFVKPDRWITSFLQRCLGRDVGLQEVQPLLTEACEILRPRYPHLTPRLLDYLIWGHERARSQPRRRCG